MSMYNDNLPELLSPKVDKENRMLYEARLKAWRDEESRTHKAVADAKTEIFALWKSGVPLDEAKKRLGL